VDNIFAVLDELRQEGVTVLLVEQNAVRTADVADRVYVLQGGAVVATGEGSAVLGAIDISGVYLGAASGREDVPLPPETK
jgi:branched-chain amino acid transport system ATP-binding protein